MPETKMKCDSCEAVLRIPATIPPGKSIKCPKCGAAIRVPGAVAKSPAPRPAADSARPAPKKASRKEEEPDEDLEQSEEKESAGTDSADDDEAPAKKKTRGEESPEDRPGKKKKRKKKKDSGGRKHLLWIGIGGGAAVLAGIIILVIALGGGSGKGGQGGKKDGSGDKDGEKGGFSGVSVERTFNSGIESPVIQMAVSSDGSLVALGDIDRMSATVRVNICDTKTGTRLCNYDTQTGGKVATPFAFSPDNSWIAAIEEQSKVIALRDPKTGALIRKLTPESPVPSLSNLAVSPRGDIIAADNSSKAVVWDCKSGSQLSTWSAGIGEGSGFAILPDGKRLVTCGRRGTLTIWNIATRTAEKEIKPNYDNADFAVSPDGKLAALHGVDRAMLMAGQNPLSAKYTTLFLDLETGRTRSQVQENFSHDARLHFLPDNRLAVLVGLLRSSSLTLVDSTSGATTLTIVKRSLREDPSAKRVCALAVTAEGDMVVYSEDGSVQFLRVKK